MHRSKLPYFFLALATVLALTALGLLIHRSGILNGSQPEPYPSHSPNALTPTPPHRPPATSDKTPPIVPSAPDSAALTPPAIPNSAEPIPPVEPAAPVASPASGVAKADPAQLVTDVAKTLEAADYDGLARLLGKDVGDAKTLEALKALAAAHPFKLKPANPIREVGELELNALTRWSLELEATDPGREHIFLDLRNTNGKWSIDKIILPPTPAEPIPATLAADPLGTADAFLQAVLKQNFEFARSFVDPQTLSDAKIAGLCILFEEGKYELRPNKPIRAMFHRGDTVGYLANVQSPDATQSAQFSLTLRQAPAPAKWIISEINLDQLLADYARRVAGGDVYYSPLVKNPQGGDTLALYFEFDEDQINPRTRRQLDIVSQILRSDPGRKITLSGHTDALGTDPYNNQLSARRAATVRDFLAAAGVTPAQIITLAKGASQPRRPNVTPSGHDDPVGRRANRRTEIYLDF